MVTRDEFKVLVKAMRAVYTSPLFIPDQNAFDVWYSMLKDLDYAVASRAIQIHIQTDEKLPTVASIRKHALKISETDENNLNEDEAWDMVYKAICNSSYHAEEEFEKLPEIIRRILAVPSRLRQLAMDNNFNLGVESSNFKKAFRQEQQRQAEKNKLSPGVARLIKERVVPSIKETSGLSIEEQLKIINEDV